MVEVRLETNSEAKLGRYKSTENACSGGGLTPGLFCLEPS